MRSVVDRNVVTRRVTVFTSGILLFAFPCKGGPTVPAQITGKVKLRLRSNGTSAITQTKQRTTKFKVALNKHSLYSADAIFMCKGKELVQDAVCQSHTGHMTGLWFLPTRPLRLNTDE